MGLCFGVNYPQNVKVLAFGACNGGGLMIPDGGWPSSGSGTSVVNSAPKSGALIPEYWFAVSSKGPGYFALTPNPRPDFGGTFANSEPLPSVAPVTEYGRIGFGMEGRLPRPGGPMPRGACCLDDGCHVISEIDCRYFSGVFLGEGVKCDPYVCTATALKGACALPSGCEPASRLECARMGGTFLGDVPCDSVGASVVPAGTGSGGGNAAAKADSVSGAGAPLSADSSRAEPDSSLEKRKR